MKSFKRRKIKQTKKQTKNVSEESSAIPRKVQVDSKYGKNISTYYQKNNNFFKIVSVNFGVVLLVLGLYYVLNTKQEPTYTRNKIESTSQSESPSANRQPEDKSNSNADRKINYSPEDLEKIDRGMKVVVIWGIPLLGFFMFFVGSVAVYASNGSKLTLVTSGALITFFGIIFLVLLSRFDDSIAVILPQPLSDTLRKQINLSSNMISIIQIAVGINIFSTGLTSQSTKKSEIDIAEEIMMLRREIEFLNAKS